MLYQCRSGACGSPRRTDRPMALARRGRSFRRKAGFQSIHCAISLESRHKQGLPDAEGRALRSAPRLLPTPPKAVSETISCAATLPQASRPRRFRQDLQPRQEVAAGRLCDVLKVGRRARRVHAVLPFIELHTYAFSAGRRFLRREPGHVHHRCSVHRRASDSVKLGILGASVISAALGLLALIWLTSPGRW